MYFITTKRMLEVCFSAHPNIQYRTLFNCYAIIYTAKRLSRYSTGLIHPSFSFIL
ncbi:MAG: hypothetical protein ENTB_04645 [Enterocloster aldenensis]